MSGLTTLTQISRRKTLHHNVSNSPRRCTWYHAALSGDIPKFDASHAFLPTIKQRSRFIDEPKPGLKLCGVEVSLIHEVTSLSASRFQYGKAWFRSENAV